MLNDVGIEGRPVYRLVTECRVPMEYAGNSGDRVFLNGETGEVYCPDCITKLQKEQRRPRSSDQVFLEEPSIFIDLTKFRPMTVREAIEFLKKRKEKQ
jgi:hypothetical protein